jgi:hypothetical protein
VPIGEGKFGVIWNGELRPEKCPAKGIAYLAIAALRRHESPPTAPVDEIWLGTSLDRKKLTQALPSLHVSGMLELSMIGSGSLFINGLSRFLRRDLALPGLGRQPVAASQLHPTLLNSPTGPRFTLRPSDN